MNEFESTTGQDEANEIIDGPMTPDELRFLQDRGMKRQSIQPTLDTRNAFKLAFFDRPPTSDGDPIVEKFNDDEIRMLGPVLKATSEPTSAILDELPYKKFDQSRILQTVAEYCLYRGWLSLCTEASRRSRDTTALSMWVDYLKREGKVLEAEEVTKRIQSI